MHLFVESEVSLRFFAAAYNGRYPQTVQFMHTLKTYFVMLYFSIISHLLLNPLRFRSNILHVYAFLVSQLAYMYIFHKYRLFLELFTRQLR
jgi:hypothetical protein